jgi:hypothetical protein
MNRKDWEKIHFDFDDSESVPNYRSDRFSQPDRSPTIDSESFKDQIGFDVSRKKAKYDDILKRFNLETDQKDDSDIEYLKRKYKLDKQGNLASGIENINRIAGIYSPNSLSDSTDCLRKRVSHLKQEKVDLERQNRISSIDKEISKIESEIWRRENTKEPKPEKWGWILIIGFLILVGLAAL